MKLDPLIDDISSVLLESAFPVRIDRDGDIISGALGFSFSVKYLKIDPRKNRTEEEIAIGVSSVSSSAKLFENVNAKKALKDIDKLVTDLHNKLRKEIPNFKIKKINQTRENRLGYKFEGIPLELTVSVSESPFNPDKTGISFSGSVFGSNQYILGNEKKAKKISDIIIKFMEACVPFVTNPPINK